MRRHIVRAAGGYRLRLSREEREALRSLPAQLRDLLESDDPALRRLFPPAYEDDAEADAEYRRLMSEELLAGKREALRIMEETLDSSRLTEDELASWLGVLNDLRLVLGTRLGVTEEMDVEERMHGPEAPTYGLYLFLGWLEEQAVDALAG